MKRLLSSLSTVLSLLLITCTTPTEKSDIPVSSVSLSEQSVELVEGETFSLTASIFPDDASEKSIIWTSSNLSVASVDQKGIVVAHSAGTATISASAGGKVATCSVIVKPAITSQTEIVERITIEPSSISIQPGAEYQLKAIIEPSNVSANSIKWESSSPSIATVNGGLVKGLSVGTAVIRASCGGKTASCSVTVIPIEIESITLNKTNLDLFIEDSETLRVTIRPENATNQEVSWTSSNTTVATVNNGVVKGLKEGTATIYANAGGKTVSCEVNVKKRPVLVQSILLKKDLLALAEGGSETLEVIVSPGGATYDKITWTSSNQSIATVTDGKIQAISAGTTVISASIGEVHSDCQVTIYRVGDERYNYLKLNILAQGDIKIQCHENDIIEYSLNGGQTWQQFEKQVLDTPKHTSGLPHSFYVRHYFSGGDIVLIRGIRTEAGPDYREKDTRLLFNKFIGVDSHEYVSTATFNVSGNVMSIFSGDSFVSNTSIQVDLPSLFTGAKIVSAEGLILPAIQVQNCDGMFAECTMLQLPPKVLPNTTLSKECYRYMFLNCTSLQKAPELPATSLAPYCYMYMFKGCSSLKHAPNLPATSLSRYCYNNMFRGCTSLLAAPELPAKTMVEGCYGGMFAECSSISNHPIIRAESMINTGGYQQDNISSQSISCPGCCEEMFMGCTSLIDPPNLSSKELDGRCYRSMFSGCIGIKKAPSLPALVLKNECYRYMFLGCTSLTTAPELPATTLANDCYQYMFYGCTNLTTAPELPATTLAKYCYRSMFNGCSKLANAPALPAPYLTSGCYMEMFYGCTSLVAAPDLPAQYLVSSCYKQMFYNCSKINRIKALFLVADTKMLASWLSGTAVKGTFIKDRNASWTTNSEANIPDGWMLVDAE